MEIFILSGLSLSRPVDTKTDFNLINIIATLSLIQYFFGNKIRRQISWHVLKLDLNAARWMPKLVSVDAQSHPALTSQSWRTTIGPLQDNWPLFHHVIGISGILPYNRNVTLQTLELFPPSHGSIMLPPREPRVFARLACWQKVHLRCYLTKNVAMFMKNSIFLKIRDLRPLNTC